MAPPPYLSALSERDEHQEESWKHIRLTLTMASRIQFVLYPWAYPLWCASHSSPGYTAGLCVAAPGNMLCSGGGGGGV